MAGGLVGLLSMMGLPKLRRRMENIGELATFRRYSKPRYSFIPMIHSDFRPKNIFPAAEINLHGTINNNDNTAFTLILMIMIKCCLGAK